MFIAIYPGAEVYGFVRMMARIGDRRCASMITTWVTWVKQTPPLTVIYGCGAGEIFVVYNCDRKYVWRRWWVTPDH